MSQTLSPSVARCYGLARVARVWSISRASAYRALKETQPNTPPRRPGPVGACSDAELADQIRRQIAASRLHGEGYRTPDLPAVAVLVQVQIRQEPGDNSRWRGGDRGRDEAAQPKPSTGTRAKRDEEKSSSTSSDKGGKSQAKSEASSSQASRARSVRQEPPPSKSSGRASASVRRESPAAGGSTPPTQPTQLPGPNANAAAQAPSSAGSTLGDTYDEKLGEVFKARIDELIKQSN